MTDEVFDLVFRGEVVKSVDVNVAKRNLQQLFKIPGEKVEALFSGKPIVLKRGLSVEVANKYRVAIKNAGALVELVTPKTSTNNLEPEAPTAQSGSSMRQGLAPKGDKSSAVAGKTVQDTNLSVLPVGSDVLKPSERAADVQADIDLSEYSVRELSGPLLDHDERVKEIPLSIDVNLDLAPTGTELLKAEEKEKEEPLAIDLSALSIAQVGVTLSEPKPIETKVPDTSHITLKE